MKMAINLGRVIHTCISNEIKLNYCYTLVNKSAVDFSKQKRDNRIIKIEDSFKKCA